ncbi:hypothetical protein VHEMI08729 [[Torrubiella] hemipterigena]|uniref:Uncharacterized protein n=1 Tax=[Torrubiella] hemipterigena TaxID=1531966 RepID=A0A0A1TQ95_9HYPO|nr:hypothetical protein VHEMI08729 [[Torrubiella] hemipterigena]
MRRLLRRSAYAALAIPSQPTIRSISSSCARLKDPRTGQIVNDFAHLRDTYATPKHPLVLAHGLFGFAELRLPVLPTIYYWHGIREALLANKATVITPSVPPSSAISHRAEHLAAHIQRSVPPGTPVNILAHSMGGLDSRYLISRLKGHNVKIASLTTIATPHRGSPVADLLVEPDAAGPIHLPRLYGVLSRLGLGTEAFEQLTTRYMREQFNPQTPDAADVRYFSYGADMMGPPGLFNTFRYSFGVINKVEGPNDGLVSVESSRWGEYQGTLMGMNHLDLINWQNRLRWAVRGWMGMAKTFNAVAFYMGIADMLAKEGL